MDDPSGGGVEVHADNHPASTSMALQNSNEEALYGYQHVDSRCKILAASLVLYESLVLG